MTTKNSDGTGNGDAEVGQGQRPEAPNLSRICMALLQQGNALAPSDTVQALTICTTVLDSLLQASTEQLESERLISELRAMALLLRANCIAFGSKGKPDALDELHPLYEAALRVAEKLADGPPAARLILMRAWRAYAAALAAFGDHQQAQAYLLQLQKHLDRGEDEGLWLQACAQMADLQWAQGKTDLAVEMLDEALIYPEGHDRICQDYVSCLVLLARILWHANDRKLARQLARQAVNEVNRIGDRCHPLFPDRVRTLTGVFGFRNYERMVASIHCPRL
ncbi:MAG TPA: hypothetical protein VFO38_01725 [Candidatus Saccharimonadales bacterium]|nr:hypothetical protein [Candidatus Saccharimonadales bacterium]